MSKTIDFDKVSTITFLRTYEYDPVFSFVDTDGVTRFSFADECQQLGALAYDTEAQAREALYLYAASL